MTKAFVKINTLVVMAILNPAMSKVTDNATLMIVVCYEEQDIEDFVYFKTSGIRGKGLSPYTKAC